MEAMIKVFILLSGPYFETGICFCTKIPKNILYPRIKLRYFKVFSHGKLEEEEEEEEFISPGIKIVKSVGREVGKSGDGIKTCSACIARHNDSVSNLDICIPCDCM